MHTSVMTHRCILVGNKVTREGRGTLTKQIKTGWWAKGKGGGEELNGTEGPLGLPRDQA